MGIGGQSFDAVEKFSGQAVDLEAEKILDLSQKYDNSNAVGEADDHRDRDEADQLAHAGQAHGEEENAGQNGGAHQICVTVDRHDAINNGDESAGWSADLNPGASQGGSDEAGDNGRPDAGGW